MSKVFSVLIIGCALLANSQFAAAQIGLQTTASHSTMRMLNRQAPAQPSITRPTIQSGADQEAALPRLQTFFRQSGVTSSSFSAPSKDLAFFCRLELKLEDATRIPVRFRLGSTQYVDYLEGKFEGWRYGY